MSRDWVIDKLSIGITYDSDLEKARKPIKKIGRDLAADPEMGPSILEPLQMQGVEQSGEFAIQIRMKMTTRPGEQFVIRRKACAMIKTAFDANGIKCAFPTVQVAGGGESPVAAPARRVAGALLLACAAGAFAQPASGPQRPASAPSAGPSMLVVGCDPGGCWDEYGVRYDAAGGGVFIRQDGRSCRSIRGRMVCG